MDTLALLEHCAEAIPGPEELPWPVDLTYMELSARAVRHALCVVSEGRDQAVFAAWSVFAAVSHFCSDRSSGVPFRLGSDRPYPQEMAEVHRQLRDAEGLQAVVSLEALAGEATRIRRARAQEGRVLFATAMAGE